MDSGRKFPFPESVMVFLVFNLLEILNFKCGAIVLITLLTYTLLYNDWWNKSTSTGPNAEGRHF